MRHRWLGLGAAALVACCAVSGPVAAYDVGSSCAVAPLQFVFDGGSVAPQVANGNPAGFICNGTSYVPLRFVADALGKQVAWDGTTDTVTVTTPATPPAPAASGSGASTASGYNVAGNCAVAPLQFVFDGSSVTPQVANGNPAGFICNGTSYVPLRFVADALGKQVGWDGATDTVTVSTPAPVVAAVTDPTLGQILVNASGMTLYRLTQDHPGFSACSGSCAALWPPLTVAGTPGLASGLAGSLTTFARPDGSLQVQYNGMPLYLFAGDAKPGDVNGQDADGIWFVVKVGQSAGN